MEEAWCLNYHSENCNKAHLFWTSHEGEKNLYLRHPASWSGWGVVTEASIALTNTCNYHLPLASD